MILPAHQKLRLIQKVLKEGAKVSSVCRENKISRKTFYAWKKKYLSAGPRRKAACLENNHPKGLKHFRGTKNAFKNEILDIVSVRPELGSHSISKILAGKKKLGNHGIYLLLKELHLNTYKGRKEFALLHRSLKTIKNAYLPSQRRLLSETRKRMVEEVLLAGKAVGEVAKEFNISRKTVWKWAKRYEKAKKQEIQLIISLEDQNPKGSSHPRGTPSWLEQKILDQVIKNPAYSTHQLAKIIPEIGNHGIQNVLLRNGLNKIDMRIQYAQTHAPEISIQPVKTWVGRLKSVFESFVPSISSAPPPPFEKIILDLVSKHPEFEAKDLFEKLPIINGLPIASYKEIEAVLRKNHLYIYEQRLRYAQSQTTPVTRLIQLSERVFEKFLLLPQGTRASLFRFTATFSATTLLTIVILGLVKYLTSFSEGTSIFVGPGMFFALLSLAVGTIFFAYSMKYYLSLALVLSFSSREGVSQERRLSDEPGIKGWLKRIFSSDEKQPSFVPSDRTSEGAGGGLQANLDHIKLERYPFISIQLPFYNEKKVANRIISACTSMDYPNFEVIVCDDSNDETIDIVNQWKKHPRVRILHRPTREGFKGGALSYALKAMDPRTEFVCVFDADFVPYPDSLTQFMKYFKSTGSWSEERNFNAADIQTMPYSTFGDEVPNEEVSKEGKVPNVSKGEEVDIFQRQEEELRAKGTTAVVAGYQWHVLNKSENWITRGVRTEYSGSYVIERPAQEITGAMKIIHGSVYCMRADVLKHFGWGTSITEDYEMTLRIYEKGFRVCYTPYIQAPSECVSTIKRLIRQRMRWAEGHSFNTRKMFGKLMFGSWMTEDGRRTTDDRRRKAENQSSVFGSRVQSSVFSFQSSKPQSSRVWIPSPLTFTEKLEFLFLTPYYLQAFLFMVGTVAWLLSEIVFQVRLPFWTALWGWSLILTNFLALPLLNSVGLFLEESEEKDYVGILSFMALCYIVVPFQAYAAVKGFIEEREGPWFRTPKTGIITDVLTRGRFYRWLTGILKWKPSSVIAESKLHDPESLGLNPYFALNTAHNIFDNFQITRKKARWVGKIFLVLLLVFSTLLISIAPGVPYLKKEVQAQGFGLLNATASLDSPTTQTTLVSSEITKMPDQVNLQFNFKKQNPGKEKLSQFKTTLTDWDGNKLQKKTEVKPKENGEVEVKVSELENLRSGTYKVKLEKNINGQKESLTQEFSWGVLAINTNKALYTPGENVYLQMAALDQYGHTKCNANLTLEITDPQGNVSTPAINTSDTCANDNVTDNPDYFTYYQLNSDVHLGKYNIKLINNSNKYSTESFFEVKNDLSYVLERSGATRINPFNSTYRMSLKIKVAQDFEGKIVENIPGDFEVIQAGEGSVNNIDKAKEIVWEVKIPKDQQMTLQYEYQAPKTSPRLFSLGPLRLIGTSSGQTLFEEAKQWQIASDAAPNLDTLYPTAYSSQTGTAWTTTTVGNVDEGIAGADGLFIVAGANSTSSIFYDVTDTPTAFVNMISLNYDIRYKITPLSNDTEVLYVQVFKSDKTTALTNEMTVVSTTAALTLQNKGSTAFTGVSTTATKADWDAAYFRIRTTHSASGGKDNSVWSIDAFELTGTYQLSPTVTLNTPTNTQTITDSTPDLKFTGTDANSDAVDYQVQVDTVNTFDSTSLNLKYADLYMQKAAAPTDNLLLEVRSTSITGTTLGTSDAVSGTSIGTSYSYIRFTFSTPVSLSGTYYLVLRRTGARDTTNYYMWRGQSTNPYAGGSSWIMGNTTWAEYNTYDRTFRLFDTNLNQVVTQDLYDDMGLQLIYGGVGSVGEDRQQQGQSFTYGAPLLDKFSTDHTGFSAGVSHPTASGVEQTYTVQTALSNGTYYWRVRAIDPSGTNAYGAWSSTYSFTLAAPVAAITGTITSSVTEANIVTGGKTIIITLTNETWVASGATFDAQRANIIQGLDAASSPTHGWNNEVRDKEGVSAVVRTSDTVVTITLSAQAGYNVKTNETITMTVPATALTGAVALTATPTFTITAAADQAPTVSLTTPTDVQTISDTTPDLVFTGTDSDADQVEYEVQVDTASTFDSVSSGFNLKYVDIYLTKSGTPTDNLSLDIRSTRDGAALGTSTIASGSLTQYLLNRFTFSTSIPLSASTKYYIVVYRSGARDTTNYWIWSNNPFAYSGNGSYTKASGTWSSESASDLAFNVYDENTTLVISYGNSSGGGNNIYGSGGTLEESGQSFTVATTAPLISALSTNHTGFSGGASHPYNSGSSVTYTVQDGSDVIIDSYPVDNYNAAFVFNTAITKLVSQSFIGTGSILNKVKLYIYRGGASPSGTVAVKIYAHSGGYGISSIPTGSVLATSNSINIADLPTSVGLVSFTFSGGDIIPLTDNVNYTIALETSVALSADNALLIGIDSTTPSHGGNIATWNGSVWSPENTYDLIFYLYTTPANNTLAPGTYYWRVRAIDPSGTNTYGAWSSGSGSLGYQSFTITTGSTSALVTAYSFQRKTFYDSGDGVYWRFYYDGTQVKIDYNSQPWTASWTAGTAVAKNTNDFSLWDDDTSVYMAYYDTNDIRVKKGTLNAASITWDSNTSGVCTSGECVALDGTGASDTYQYAYVTKDSSGYVWVVAQFYNGTNYYMKARRTSAANDLTAWGTATNLSLTSNTDANVYGSISSLGSQHMYATWIRGTAIEGQKYTEGSGWAGSATSIATGKSGVSANFSMSSDTGNNLHLAYVDSSDLVQYWKYTTSWSGPTQVSGNSTTNTNVSVSVDTANDNIYVLYIRSSATAGTIYYNKYTTSWGGETATGWSVVSTNAHLTTNYSDSGKIFAEWTSGAGSPYTLNWNYIIIPEKIWLFMGLGLVIPELLRRRRKTKMNYDLRFKN